MSRIDRGALAARVLGVLRDAGTPLPLSDVAPACGRSYEDFAVRDVLDVLAAAGVVTKRAGIVPVPSRSRTGSRAAAVYELNPDPPRWR